MADAGIDLLFIRVSQFAFDRMNQLSWAGLELADVKVILSRPVRTIDVDGTADFIVDDSADRSVAAELRPMARDIARRSRFARTFGEEALRGQHARLFAGNIEHAVRLQMEIAGAVPRVGLTQGLALLDVESHR